MFSLSTFFEGVTIGITIALILSGYQWINGWKMEQEQMGSQGIYTH